MRKLLDTRASELDVTGRALERERKRLGVEFAAKVGELSEAKKRLESATAAAGALHSALSIPGMSSALPILSLFSSALAAQTAPAASGAASAGAGARVVTDADAVADPFGVGGNGGGGDGYG